MAPLARYANRLWPAVRCRIQMMICSIASPLDGYTSALIDARRLSLAIFVIFAFSTYLFLEEQSRRVRVLDMIFFDHVLETIQKFGSVTALPKDAKVTSPDFVSLANSAVLPAIEVTASKSMRSMEGISTSITNCDVNFYKLRLKEKPTNALTDLLDIPLVPVGDRHVLIEFPFLCNIFDKKETIYALVGQFRLVLPEETELGTVYDNGEGFRRYESLSSIKSRILRIAQNETGKYYNDGQVKVAISKLLEVTENVPSVFGVSLPARLTGIILPVALALVSFTFYHRARRIIDNMDSVWIIMHAKGILEIIVASGWKMVIVSSPVVVYLTASLYLSPSAELQGSIDVRAKQSFSTNSVGIDSADLWLGGLQNSYVLFLCLLSLILNVIALTAISRVKNIHTG